MNTSINFAPIGPELILTTVATIVLLLDITLKNKYRDFISYFSLAGLLGALAYLIIFFGLRGNLVLGQLTIDSLSVYIRLAILIVSIAITLAAIKNDYAINNNQGEFFALMLYSVVGTMIMASAGDLVTLYIGLELSTIPTFVLVAFRKSRASSPEAIIKFFILGLLSSAFLLYGLSFIYALTGELNLIKIAHALGSGISPALAVASLLIIAGFGFKITAVPFHFWAPDTYEGSPAIIISYIASVSKLGAFAIIARFFIEALQVTDINWSLWFGAIAAITMTLGNLMALPQKNIKRMMAYSGVGHTGYLLVGLAATSTQGIWAMFFYLFAYVFAAIGVFFVLSIRGAKEENDDINSFAGMYKLNGGLAIILTFFFLSLIGIPPFAGFFGKAWLAKAALESGQTYLSVLIFLNSVISVGYYVRVIKVMYLSEPDEDKIKIKTPITSALALGISIIAIFYIGLFNYPIPFYDLAQKIVENMKF